MGKKKADDCPMMPGWLVTYGDLMSLLLTFFILLQSFSSIQESEFKKAVGSIMIALGVYPLADSMILTPMQGKKGSSKAEIEAEIEDLSEAMQKELTDLKNEIPQDEGLSINKNLKIDFDKEGAHITISDSVVFASASATLKPDFKKILSAIGKVVAPRMDKFELIVEGHTDNVPISTPQFPSNWELSTSRALSVLKFMITNNNLRTDKVTAVGYGEYHPIATSLTPEGRAKNRRVEIFIKHLPRTIVEFKDEKNKPQ